MPPTTQQSPSTPTRKPRGFAAIDPKLRSEIARKGGLAAHASGVAHEFTSEEARAAGRLGGRAAQANFRARMAKAKLGEPVAAPEQESR
jgi:general stress protein YciG